MGKWDCPVCGMAFVRQLTQAKHIAIAHMPELPLDNAAGSVLEGMTGFRCPCMRKHYGYVHSPKGWRNFMKHLEKHGDLVEILLRQAVGLGGGDDDGCV